MGYMDFHNVDFTLPINVTETIEVLGEIISERTGTPNIVNLGEDLKDDLK